MIRSMLRATQCPGCQCQMDTQAGVDLHNLRTARDGERSYAAAVDVPPRTLSIVVRR